VQLETGTVGGEPELAREAVADDRVAVEGQPIVVGRVLELRTLQLDAVLAIEERLQIGGWIQMAEGGDERGAREVRERGRIGGNAVAVVDQKKVRPSAARRSAAAASRGRPKR